MVWIQDFFLKNVTTFDHGFVNFEIIVDEDTNICILDMQHGDQPLILTDLPMIRYQEVPNFEKLRLITLDSCL